MASNDLRVLLQKRNISTCKSGYCQHGKLIEKCDMLCLKDCEIFAPVSCEVCMGFIVDNLSQVIEDIREHHSGHSNRPESYPIAVPRGMATTVRPVGMATIVRPVGMAPKPMPAVPRPPHVDALAKEAEREKEKDMAPRLMPAVPRPPHVVALAMEAEKKKEKSFADKAGIPMAKAPHVVSEVLRGELDLR